MLLPRTKALFFQRFAHSKSGGAKKKTESVGGVGELEVGKSPLSDLGGDRLREMEKVHLMESEEVCVCVCVCVLTSIVCVHAALCMSVSVFLFVCCSCLRLCVCCIHVCVHVCACMCVSACVSAVNV